MLDLRKLQIFVQVVQAGSFSGAAERLLMTQSGVSQHIQDLERGFAAPLFERRARGVELTDSGRLLLGYAEQLLQIAHEAELALTTLTQNTHAAVRLGATPGIGTYVLPTCLTEFQGRYPQIQIDLTTRTTPQVLEAVQSGALDLGIVEGEPEPADPAVRVRRLASVPQWLVVGPQHPWWDRASVALDELPLTSLITRQRGSHSRLWLDQVLASAGLTVRIAAEFDNVESIKRATAGGKSATILPRYAFEQELAFGLLRVIPWRGIDLRRQLSAVWASVLPPGPAASAFLASITRMLE